MRMVGGRWQTLMRNDSKGLRRPCSGIKEYMAPVFSLKFFFFLMFRFILQTSVSGHVKTCNDRYYLGFRKKGNYRVLEEIYDILNLVVFKKLRYYVPRLKSFIAPKSIRSVV
jgi:hypothetical protein